MTTAREPIPPGAVSSIRGRRQVPALRGATGIGLVSATGALAFGGDVGHALGVAAVTVVTAMPLLRVSWLVFRWTEERDWRFVALGVALLGVVGLGALLALTGVGGD
ncbi:MAG: hypothetical protein WD598_13495 [Acidimicrobiia bacterium]